MYRHMVLDNFRPSESEILSVMKSDQGNQRFHTSERKKIASRMDEKPAWKDERGDGLEREKHVDEGVQSGGDPV